MVVARGLYLARHLFTLYDILRTTVYMYQVISTIKSWTEQEEDVGDVGGERGSFCLCIHTMVVFFNLFVGA